jgi:hypothetical protein
MALVQNTLTETVPGAGTIRLGMDFGNVQEILAGGEIESCTISLLPATSPAFTINQSSKEITGGYLVSALFSGGDPGDYEVTFTPTLVGGQQLPPRTGVITLEAP